MRTIAVSGAKRLLNGKQLILNAATNIDRAEIQPGQGWLRLDDIEYRATLNRVNHFSRHISTVGEIVAVREPRKDILCHVQILEIYLIHTDDLTADEMAAFGCSTQEELLKQTGGSRKMWAMWVTLANPQQSTSIIN